MAVSAKVVRQNILDIINNDEKNVDKMLSDIEDILVSFYGEAYQLGRNHEKAKQTKEGKLVA